MLNRGWMTGWMVGKLSLPITTCPVEDERRASSYWEAPLERKLTSFHELAAASPLDCLRNNGSLGAWLRGWLRWLAYVFSFPSFVPVWLLKRLSLACLAAALKRLEDLREDASAGAELLMDGLLDVPSPAGLVRTPEDRLAFAALRPGWRVTLAFRAGSPESLAFRATGPRGGSCPDHA